MEVGMARPSRTKEVIARDVAYVLNAPLDPATKKAVLNNAAWAWTTFHGKRDGCPMWSVEAKVYQLAYLQKCIDLEEADGRRRRSKRDLIHDHAVPRRVVLQILLGMSPTTPEAVFRVCEKLLHGVVITPKEHDRLDSNGLRQEMPMEFWDPASLVFENPWLRYQRCGIQLIPVPPDWPMH
jgi:hypothetical protein